MSHGIPHHRAGFALLVVACVALPACKKRQTGTPNDTPPGEDLRISWENSERTKRGTTKKDPRITWENFERIKRGMTKKEVDDILGPGKETPKSGTPDLAGDSHWKYGDIDAMHIIIVGFEDGRVVGKTAILTDENGRHWSKDG